MAKRKKKAAKKAARKKAPRKKKAAAKFDAEGKLATGVSGRAYARHREVSFQAVLRAIREGRLTRSVNRTPRGHYRIDVELADEEWLQNTDPRQAARAASTPTGPRQDDLFGDLGTAPVAGDKGDAANRGPSKAQLDRVRTFWDTRRAQLQFQQLAGELVNADAVRVRVHSLAVETREAVMTTVGTASSELGLTHDQRLHLQAAMERALHDVVGRARGIADGARGDR